MYSRRMKDPLDWIYPKIRIYDSKSKLQKS